MDHLYFTTDFEETIKVQLKEAGTRKRGGSPQRVDEGRGGKADLGSPIRV